MADTWYWSGGENDDGYTTDTTQAGYGPQSYLYGAAITVSTTGTATSIAIKGYGNDATCAIKLGLYNSSYNLIAQGTATLPNSVTGWAEATISGSIPSTGTYYVLASAVSDIARYAYTSPGAGVSAEVAYASAMPASFTKVDEAITIGVKVYVQEGGGAATITQEGYRWRLDDGDQANATWAAVQDTGITAPANSIRRLRVILDTSGDANAANYQLEYKEANDANYTKLS